jgi:hypothetical protein
VPPAVLPSGKDLNSSKKVVFEGVAKVGKVTIPPVTFSLNPEDLSSPLSLQMALNKLFENIANALEGEIKPRYLAEVKFNDHLGTPVVFAIDLGDRLPPFSKDKVKVKITVELYEDEDERLDVPP